MRARADLFRALGALCEPPEPGHIAIAAAIGLPGGPASGDYAEVFLFGAYPYASVYLGEEGMLGGEARDRVAGFWRALGIRPPTEPDHIAALLGLYATLIELEESEPDKARAALARSSRKALLWEHLLSWLPAYLDKLMEIAPPYYADWARLLGDALIDEAADVGGQTELPLQLRAAPGLPETDAPSADWVQALLSAVRTGVVLTRFDLRRGARELGIGARVAERAYMLRSMLEQDAPATTSWLAAEASRWAIRHQEKEATLGRVAVFWRTRAEASNAALRSLAQAVPAAARDDR
ncbi:MAG TPA: molecular chaperone TorD family protein [Candidatus Limnocylindrales bacterium]|nr:molecular chaperone TorD family protein [Candidatus Limnocylindrales bacterium]